MLLADTRPLLYDSAQYSTFKRLDATADSIMADTAFQARLERMMADTALQARLNRMVVDTAIQTRFVSVSLQLDSLLADLKRCPPRKPS
jgi:hypothetical protein